VSSKSNWYETSYNEFVEKYGGKWVLIMNNKVCFIDESFEKVYKEYEKVREHPNTEMVLIDDGEASFYTIKSANEGNYP